MRSRAGALTAAHGLCTFTRDWQVSIRASAKPGRGGVGLRGCDFKCSKNVYAMISRQSPNVIWLEVLKSSDPAVRAFARRNKLGYPDQRFLDHGDTFDAFMQELDLDRSRKEGGFFQSSIVPKKKDEVGSVYPSLLELEDIHSWVLESMCHALTLCCAAFLCNMVHASACSHVYEWHTNGTDCPVWAHFKASGEQDLDGFDDHKGNDENEDDEPDDDDDDDDDEDQADEHDVWAEEGMAAGAGLAARMEDEEELEGTHAHSTHTCTTSTHILASWFDCEMYPPSLREPRR